MGQGTKLRPHTPDLFESLTTGEFAPTQHTHTPNIPQTVVRHLTRHVLPHYKANRCPQSFRLPCTPPCSMRNLLKPIRTIGRTPSPKSPPCPKEACLPKSHAGGIPIQVVMCLLEQLLTGSGHVGSTEPSPTRGRARHPARPSVKGAARPPSGGPSPGLTRPRPGSGRGGTAG